MRSMRSTWSEHNTIGGNMRLARIVLSAVLSGCGPVAVAQSAADYPHRAIRIIVPLAAGGNVEIVALAKSQPGKISYASSGNGSTGHMAAELFNRQAGVTMLHVPYKGNSQALVDVISGQVAMMFDQVSTSTPQIKAGKVRAIAVTSFARSPLLPEVPTVDESGVPGYEDITFNGMVAPAGTPRGVLLRLNRAVAEAVRAPDLYKRFIERGVELKASASPEEFTEHIRAEFEKKGRLAREAGIKPE